MKKILLIILGSLLITGCSTKVYQEPLEDIMYNIVEGVDISELQIKSIRRHDDTETINLDTVEFQEILFLMPFDDTEGKALFIMKCEDAKTTIKQLKSYINDDATIKSDGNLVLVSTFENKTTEKQIFENFDKLGK